MNIKMSSFQMQNMSGLKQALSMSMMQKALNKDGESVEALVKMMESSVSPHLGQSIDLKV